MTKAMDGERIGDFLAFLTVPHGSGNSFKVVFVKSDPVLYILMSLTSDLLYLMEVSVLK